MERHPACVLVRAATASPVALLVAVALGLTGCASAHGPGGGGGGGDGGGGFADSGPGSPDASSLPDGMPDANNCSKQPCSLSPQCGCATGMACDLDGTDLANGATTCRAAGAGTETTTCSAVEDCAAGYGCIGGRCRLWCTTDNDCPGAGGECLVGVVFGTNQTPVPGATTCTTDCDPTSSAPSACPATWACHVYQNQTTMAYLTDCDSAPASGGGNGASCDTNGNADCAPGYDCIALTQGSTTTNECLQTCVCPGGNCAAGLCNSGSCNGFQTPVVIGGTTYGVCF